jgi:hypothetical protein
MRRARPLLEALEGRLVLSQTAAGLSVVANSSPATGEFFHDFKQFNYTTPQGTHVEIAVAGRGSLEGTTVDSSGALHLLYSKTNAYTRIVSNVHGGTGQANLASIYSRDVFINGAATSLSGVGATVLHAINLRNFNLIDGGVINVTSGINNLTLNSMGANTQIQLRELPSTVTAGETTTTTNASISNNFVTGAFLVQSLAGINGEFLSAGNIINVTAPSTPNVVPAPPGIVIKINRINGNVNPPPNLLSDAEMFGYDATTGQVVRFSLQPTTVPSTGQLNMGSLIGQPDMAFQVQPPGSSAPVALSVGRDANRLVLLVDMASTISVYDATFGTFLGSFTIPAGFNALASTDSLSVIGSVQTNQLQMIDVAASLAAGTAQLPADNPPNYNLSKALPGFSLVGGLTGLVGTNEVFATVAATFNTFQPNVTQLGLLTVATSTGVPQPSGAFELVHGFSTVSQKPIQTAGSFTPVNPADNPQLIGVPLGSFDSSLALNSISTNTQNPGASTNKATLLGPVTLTNRGSIKFNISNPITDLTEAFRPDLTGSTANGTGPALIDVQGNIQSFRGISANGLVLNDTGYLNLLRTGQLSNSTILAQPIGHVMTPMSSRTNTTLLSSNNRDFLTRGGVQLVTGLHQIGPLSLTNDSSST